MSIKSNYIIVLKNDDLFLAEYLFLALDKRHIMLDYYHTQTIKYCLKRE